jgi:hypothetical protein
LEHVDNDAVMLLAVEDTAEVVNRSAGI